MNEFFFLLFVEFVLSIFFFFFFFFFFSYYLYNIYFLGKWVEIYNSFYYLKNMLFLFIFCLIYIMINIPVYLWFLNDFLLYSDYYIYIYLMGFLYGFFIFLFIMLKFDYDLLYRIESLLIFIIFIYSVFISFKSYDLLNLFLYVEVLSLCLYILLSLNYLNIKSAEAVLKYFFFSIIISFFFLCGIFLIYISSLTFNLLKIKILFLLQFFKTSIYLNGMIVLIIIVFLFKLGIVPFHFWVVEVYFGICDSIFFFVLIFSKYVFFYIFFKLYMYIYIYMYVEFLVILQLFSLLSIFVGVIGSLSTEYIKQIFAYSSIFNSGMLLFCFWRVTIFSLFIIFFFLINYMLILLYFFSIYNLIKKKVTVFITIYDLLLISRFYFISFQLLIIFLSYVGIPPLLGFCMKLLVLSNLLIYNVNNFYLILLILLINIINIFIFIRLVSYLFFFYDLSSLINYKKKYDFIGFMSLNFLYNIGLYIFIYKYIYIYIYISYLYNLLCFI